MTIIAAIKSPAGWVILGDAMISTREEGVPEFPLPTHDTPNDLREFTLGRTSRLERKIMTLTSTIVVGWAGNRAKIDRFFSNLYQSVPDKTDRLTPDEFLALIEASGLHSLDGDNAAFIGCITTEGLLVEHHGCEQNERFLLASSSAGRNIFKQELEEEIDASWGWPKPAPQLAWSMLQQLYLLQVENEWGIIEGIGGVFDAICDLASGFVTLSNYMVVFRHWWLDSDHPARGMDNAGGINTKITRIVYVTHINQTMLVLRWSSGNPAQQMYIVTPPGWDRELPSENLGKLESVIEVLHNPITGLSFFASGNIDDYFVGYMPGGLGRRVRLFDDDFAAMLRQAIHAREAQR